MRKRFRLVGADHFRADLAAARDDRPAVADATSAPDELPDGAAYYVTADGRAGFGVADGGELIGVYSVDRGNGDAILRAAIAAGARRLDCFDGYLPAFYARHGFRETDRTPNWTPGGPDVVYMVRP